MKDPKAGRQMRLDEMLSVHPGLQYAACKSASTFYRLSGLFRPASRAKLGNSSEILIILGAGRSGNTLLRKILMERGSIYIPPESYVLSSQAYSFLLSAALPWQQQVGLLLSRLEYSREFETFPVDSLREFALEAAAWPLERRSLGGLIDGLYRWLAVKAGVTAEWVGDKTPMNLARIGLISRVFPRGKYVYIERDPVEVAWSYRRAGLYDTLEQGALRWKRSREAWLRFRRNQSPCNCIEVRFADLLSAPQETSGAVLDGFCIPKRPRPLDILAALGDVNLRSHHAQVRHDVSNARVSARAELTPGERDSLRAVLGDVVRKAGYETI